MRFVATLLLAATFALAADTKPAVGPVPIPKDRHEEISRVMLKLQQAQMAQVQAQAAVDSATSEYRSLLDKLRKEFDAPGCDLAIDKTWHCPPAPAAK
jgi:hypothetical protein